MRGGDRLMEGTSLGVWTDRLNVGTTRPLEFVDLTDQIAHAVTEAGLRQGLVCAQVLHTTAAIVVNEDEPLLLADLAATLERLAPRGAEYGHDDLGRRTAVPPDEPRNGHAHCKAVLLPCSVTLGVAGGRLALGRWQRVFLVELDGGRLRAVQLTVLGTTHDERRR